MQLCMQYMKKDKYAFFHKFLRIFWSDLVGASDFLEAVDIDKLLISSRNGPVIL